MGKAEVKERRYMPSNWPGGTNYRRPCIVIILGCHPLGNVRPAYQRLSVTQNSLSFTIPHVWNSIPADLKNLCFQI